MCLRIAMRDVLPRFPSTSLHSRLNSPSPCVQVNTLMQTHGGRVTQGAVVRRYNDFAWLHDALQQVYVGCLVPPLPEKAIYGRFGRFFIEVRAAGGGRRARPPTGLGRARPSWFGGLVLRCDAMRWPSYAGTGPHVVCLVCLRVFLRARSGPGRAVGRSGCGAWSCFCAV